MLITWWILMIVFGFMALLWLRKILFGSIKLFELLLFFASVIISAIAAGMIFG